MVYQSPAPTYFVQKDIVGSYGARLERPIWVSLAVVVCGPVATWNHMDGPPMFCYCYSCRWYESLPPVLLVSHSRFATAQIDFLEANFHLLEPVELGPRFTTAKSRVRAAYAEVSSGSHAADCHVYESRNGGPWQTQQQAGYFLAINHW